MRLSGRPSPPPHPHPRRGRGKKLGEGAAAGPRGRAATEGLGAEAALGAGGGRPRGARSPARRAACAGSRPPQHGSRHLAGVFRDQSSPCLGCVPRSSKPEESRRLGVTAGLRSFLVRFPPRFGLPANLGARSGVSARGRARRPGGPRLQFVPSPSLPSPSRRRREEGAVGPARAECAAGAGRLSRSPAGCPRGRTGVAAYRRGTPGARPPALARAAKGPSNRCWHSQGVLQGSPRRDPKGRERNAGGLLASFPQGALNPK